MPKSIQDIRADNKFKAVSQIEATLLQIKEDSGHILVKYVEPIVLDYREYSFSSQGTNWKLLLKYSKKFPAVLSVLITVTHPEIKRGPGSISAISVELIVSPIDYKSMIVTEINADSYGAGEDEEGLAVRHRYIRMLRGMFAGIKVLLDDIH